MHNTRNFGGRVVFLLYAFGLIGTVLVVLPVISFVTVIFSSAVVLEQCSLLLLDLLCGESLFCPVLLAILFILSFTSG